MDPPQINFLGLRNLRPSDRFNEYVLGRSAVRCDVSVQKLEMPPIPPPLPSEDDDDDDANGELKEQMQKRELKQKQHDHIHSLISNRHCRIYCLLHLPEHHNSNNHDLTPSSANSNTPEMEVFVEDTSGNGTLINSTILLSRNERRKLHTGDVICFVNPKLLAKRVRSPSDRKMYMTHYSYLFVNLYEQEARHFAVACDWRLGNGVGVGGGDNSISSSSRRGRGRGRSRSGDLTSPMVMGSGAEDRSKRRDSNGGLVNVRALKCHSINNVANAIGPTADTDVSNSRSTNHHQPPASKTSNLASFLNIPNLRSASTARRRIEEDYDLRDLLGTGTCGEVRRAIHRRSGEERAVKIISIAGRGGMGSAGMFSSEKLSAIQAEAEILCSLDHPYVVKLFDVFVSPGKAIYLVMELIKGGDLFDRIVQRERYTEVQARRLFRRILTAVHYLHEERGIVHRDLKPENILVVDRRSDVNIKLTDFGVAKNMTAEGLKTFCGTPQYFAPEVLRRSHTVKGNGRYGKEADCWSIGVILFILLSGSPPFDVSGGFDSVANAKVMFYEDQWRGVSTKARDLICRLLEKDPRKRMSVSGACEHEWVLVEDGDTHCHPLHDPVVVSRPSASTTAADLKRVGVKSPANHEVNGTFDVGQRGQISSHNKGISPVAVNSPLSAPRKHDNHKSGHSTSKSNKNCGDNIDEKLQKELGTANSDLKSHLKDIGKSPAPPQSQKEEDDVVESDAESFGKCRMPAIGNEKSVSKVIQQAMDVSQQPGPGSPIQRRRLFAKDMANCDSIRKITKEEAESIRYAGVSVPKPSLRASPRVKLNNCEKKESFLPDSNLNGKFTKKKVQQILFPSAAGDKPVMEESQVISTFSLNQLTHLKTKINEESSRLTFPENRDAVEIRAASSVQKTDLPEDELQSDFSDDDNFENIKNVPGNLGSPNSSANRRFQSTLEVEKGKPISKKEATVSVKCKSKRKPDINSSRRAKETSSFNKPDGTIASTKRRKLVQTLLFGKPPPHGEGTEYNEPDAILKSSLHEPILESESIVTSLIENVSDTIVLAETEKVSTEIKLQRNSSGGSSGNTAKGTQKSITSWFQAKK